MHPVWFGSHEGYHGVYNSFVKLIITNIVRRDNTIKNPFFPPEFFHRDNARESQTLLQHHRGRCAYVLPRPVSLYACFSAQDNECANFYFSNPFFWLNCPNGNRGDKPLFLQKDAFEGKLWMPWSLHNPNDVGVSNS
jgi:hypothetical protein